MSISGFINQFQESLKKTDYARELIDDVLGHVQSQEKKLETHISTSDLDSRILKDSNGSGSYYEVLKEKLGGQLQTLQDRNQILLLDDGKTIKVTLAYFDSDEV